MSEKCQHNYESEVWYTGSTSYEEKTCVHCGHVLINKAAQALQNKSPKKVKQ